MTHLVKLLVWVVWENFKVLVRGVVEKSQHSQPPLHAKANQV